MCDCTVCGKHRKVEAIIETLSEEHKAVIRDLQNDCGHAEMDRDYYKAIVYGTWPTADEVIKAARSK